MSYHRSVAWVPLGIVLLTLPIAGALAPRPASGQPRLQICPKCLPTISDTSSSTGVISMPTAALTSVTNPPVVFVGKDRGVRYAAPMSGGWSIEPVDTTTVASGVSLALDASGNPMISYRDGNGLLIWAHRLGSSWSFEFVETTGGTGEKTSMVNSASGVGIAYQDSAAGVLKYAERTGAGSWAITAVTSGGSNGRYASLVTDGATRAISYYDQANGDLRLAESIGTSWTTSLVDDAGNVGGFTSLVGGPSLGGFGIAYYDFGNGDLKYAYRVGSSWVIETVDAAGDVGRHCTAVALGATVADDIEITYYDRTNGDLKRARKQGSVWSISVLDGLGNVGGFAVSVAAGGAIDTVGAAYADGSNGDLYYRWHTNVVTAVAESRPTACIGLEWLRSPAGADGRIRFTVPRAGRVRVSVHDAQGRHVATPLVRDLAAGPIDVPWNGADSRGMPVPAGVFFIRVETPDGRASVPAAILR